MDMEEAQVGVEELPTQASAFAAAASPKQKKNMMIVLAGQMFTAQLSVETSEVEPQLKRQITKWGE